MSNIIRVAQVREAVTKTTRLLAQDKVEVRQRGGIPHVAYCQKTGRVLYVNLPVIPDDPSQEFLDALQGFLDHEVAHVLFTNSKELHHLDEKAVKEGINLPRMTNLINIVEDVRINWAMSDKFKGSAYNITNAYDFSRTKTVMPLLEEARKVQDPDKRATDIMKSCFVVWTRAKCGDHTAQKFMDAEKLWPYFNTIERAFPSYAKRLAAMKTSADAAALGYAFMKATTPPPPPPPPPSPSSCKSDEKKDKEEEEQEEQEDNSESEEGDGTPDKDSEGDDTDEADREEEKGDKSDPKDDPEGEEDGDPEDEEPEGQNGDDEPQEDAGEEPGSEGDPADEDGAQEEPESDDQAGDQDDDADEEEGDEAPSSGAQDDSQDQDEQSGEEEKEDEAGKPSASEEPPPEQDEEPGEEEDDAGDDGDELTEEEAAVIHAGMDDLKDMDDTMANVIAVMMPQEFSNAKYIEYTRDFDRIETAPVHDGEIDMRDLEAEIMAVSAVMQKDVQRLITARNQSVMVRGYGSGRLNPGALHRLQVFDDRIYRRKQVNETKDVAVQLVCDCSGSMDGEKFRTAIQSAWAFSQVLDRIGIANEVIGFTTSDFPDGTETWGNTGVVEKVREFADQIGADPRSIRFDPIYMPVFKDFGEKFGLEAKRRMASAHDHRTVEMGSNIDGASLLYAAQRLLARKEKRKLMIVFSDGNPAGYCNMGMLQLHLGDVVKDLNKVGIETIGVGIQDEAVRRYYPKSFVIQSLQELPQRVLGELRDFLLR